MSQRRLPVYLLLDCSESMAGGAIEQVALGVRTLVAELCSNPLALETVYLSVITFAREAKQVVPLTELLHFKPPPLAVRTGTALGAALRLLQECLKRDVVRSTPTTKGDYKPLVFLLTDGQPTDDWEAAADALRSPNSPRVANVYAVGCGPDVDLDVLRAVTDIVIQMDELTPEAFRKCFVWLSASVQSASTGLGEGQLNDQYGVPPLPSDVLKRAPESSGPKDPTPRQVFLHARCSRSKRPYLMRFARRPYDGRYEAIAAHPLEVLEEGDAELLPPINTALLDGCPSCPYCENPLIIACPCGALFCGTPDVRGPVPCPACHAQLVPGRGGDFDIKRAQG
jgi:uncharacterized protein YegL